MKMKELLQLKYLFLLISLSSANYTFTENVNEKDFKNDLLFSGSKNSISLSKTGPIPIFDYFFMRTINKFVRERIPVRRMNVIGNGAFGYFICTNPKLSQLTKADFLSHVGKRTEIFAKFNTQGTDIRHVEADRGVTGLAVRFYTQQGNYDLLTTHLPVFFVREALRIIDQVHASSQTAKSNIHNDNYLFDFNNYLPENILGQTFLQSNQGLYNGWRTLNTYVGNAFKFVNHEDDYVFVRFKIESRQRLKYQYWDNEQAAWIRGHFNDYDTRDLMKAIDRKDFPRWWLKAQLMKPEMVDKLSFNPFDATKVWDEKDFPYITLGEIVLDKKPSNWFEQVEKIAMNPANLVPGIQITMDKLLQGRIYAYNEAQQYRLGSNYDEITINKPLVCLEKFKFSELKGKQCDHSMMVGGEPIAYGEEELKMWNTQYDDNYSQVGKVWRSYGEEEKRAIAQRLARLLLAVKDDQIRKKYFGHLKKASKDYMKHVQVAFDEARNASARGSQCFCDKKFLRKFNLKFHKSK